MMPPTANFARSFQERRAVDLAVNVEVEQVEQLLRKVGRFLSFHCRQVYWPDLRNVCRAPAGCRHEKTAPAEAEAVLSVRPRSQSQILMRASTNTLNGKFGNVGSYGVARNGWMMVAGIVLVADRLRARASAPYVAT